MELNQQIEGVLFYKASPMRIQTLCKIFDVDETEIKNALGLLQERLLSGATRIIVTEQEIELALMPELDTIIESIRKDEMKRDIGKAGAETLAIVLYKGPLSRADIDRIRGVNSSYILRSLLVRGLIEKIMLEKRTQFRTTPALLSHLGITDRTELSEFENVMNALDVYEAEQKSER